MRTGDGEVSGAIESEANSWLTSNYIKYLLFLVLNIVPVQASPGDSVLHPL